MSAAKSDSLERQVLLFLYRGMLWTRCRMRKEMPGFNGGILRAGAWGYRPLTNSKDRMKRLRDVPQLAQILAKQNSGITGKRKEG